MQAMGGQVLCSLWNPWCPGWKVQELTVLLSEPPIGEPAPCFVIPSAPLGFWELLLGAGVRGEVNVLGTQVQGDLRGCWR